MNEQHRKQKSYSLFAAGVIFIYLTIPVARAFQEFIYQHLGASFFGYLVIFAIIGAFVSTVTGARIFSRRELSLSNYLWLTIIAGVYVYFTIKLWERPEEAVHFIEYSTLSFLAYKALRHQVDDHTIYFSATLMIFFFGTLDEVIQWITPERYWDIRDVWLNVFSGALFQLAIYKGISPRGIKGRWTPISIRILSFWAILSIILLGFCMSNTPSRIAFYSTKIPGLSHLAKNKAMMSEYGYKHHDPKIGAFYSRFTVNDLKTMDHDRAPEYARILNQWDPGKYEAFLSRYNPISNPFLYEMRIHHFRRDRYLSKAQNEDIPIKRKAYFTISYKENLILETYFGKTLRNTTYFWDDSTREAVTAASDVTIAYESPVSSELFTTFSEKQVWGVIGGIVFVLAFINLRSFRRKSKPRATSFQENR